MSDCQARVIVSGISWMGSGFGSLESALHDTFRLATDEVVLTAYTIGIGARSFFSELEVLLERGIKIRMIVNRYHTQSKQVRKKLESLRKMFPLQLHLLSFVSQREDADLHANIMIIDRRYAIVGSANFSQRGFWDNHELALLLEGLAVADIVRAVDRLLASPRIVHIPTTKGNRRYDSSEKGGMTTKQRSSAKTEKKHQRQKQRRKEGDVIEKAGQLPKQPFHRKRERRGKPA